LRKVAQHFFLLCDTFTRINSSPSPRPSGSSDDEELSGEFLVDCELPAEGEFLAVGGPGDFMASALVEFDIFALKRQDLQVN
jgi:hypothetical protein